MTFLPDDEFKTKMSINLAPMIDFLFLLLMFFATLAITRITTKETNIDLVEIRPETQSSIASGNTDTKVINLTIDADGHYQWVTDLRDHPMDSAEAIKNELLLEYNKGLLPQDKSQTYVLVKIDKKTQWEPILQALFAIRDAGFDARPVYEPEDARVAEVD